MRLRIALIGCGRRGTEVYLPVITKMRRHFELVATCDEDARRAEAAAQPYGVPAFRSIESLLVRSAPDVAVVAVTPPPSHANGEAALALLEAGIHLLAETPAAKTLAEAQALLAAAARSGARVEVGENYYRTPAERLKHALIDAGVFGSVHVCYADFVGHGYHGISVLRSYVGFDVPVQRVRGWTRDYAVQPHVFRPDEPPRCSETWQFGLLEFQNGARGVFSFSTLGYGSPLRWGRRHCQSRLYAERGLLVGEEMAILQEDRTRPIQVRRRSGEVEGCPVLEAYETDLPDGLGWENPLRAYPLRDGDQHSELTIALQLLSLHRAISGNTAPEYGLWQACYDRAVDLAMMESWSNDGVPVVPSSRGAGRA